MLSLDWYESQWPLSIDNVNGMVFLEGSYVERGGFDNDDDMFDVPGQNFKSYIENNKSK